MLKECNNQDLDRNEISGKYYLFFQVWKELTERKTLDSYQYRIMNSLEALSELSVVIGYKLNRFYNTNHNIDECKSGNQRNNRDRSSDKNALSQYLETAYGTFVGKIRDRCTTKSIEISNRI